MSAIAMVRLRRGSTKVGCLLYLLFISAALYFGVNAFEIYYRYLQFKDAMAQEVRFRSSAPNSSIIAHLQTVADSLGLPEEAYAIQISRENGRITVEAGYDEYLELPWYSRPWHFEPRAVGTY